MKLKTKKKKTLRRELPMPVKPDQRTLTAYHEAGHALAHFVYGIPFEGVSIESDATSQGRIVQKPIRISRGDLLESQVDGLIVRDLAGMAAENRKSGRTRWVDYGQRDFDVAFDQMVKLTSLCVDEYEHYMKYQWSRANVLLQRKGHWLGVERVAAKLLEVGYMSADEVRTILGATLEQDFGHLWRFAAKPSSEPAAHLFCYWTRRSLRGWWNKSTCG